MGNFSPFSVKIWFDYNLHLHCAECVTEDQCNVGFITQNSGYAGGLFCIDVLQTLHMYI